MFPGVCCCTTAMGVGKGAHSCGVLKETCSIFRVSRKKFVCVRVRARVRLYDASRQTGAVSLSASIKRHHADVC